jgi:hypothetical protein
MFIIIISSLEDLLGDPVSNHVVLHVNVFGSRIIDVVLRDAASSNVVNGSSNGKDDGDQFGEQVPKVQPFSACIGGRAMSTPLPLTMWSQWAAWR